MAALQLMLMAFLASQSAVLARVIMEPVQNSTQMPATQDTCKDCTQIIELFMDMLSNADTQTTIQNTLDGLCKRLPGSIAQNACYAQVKRYLPLALNILSKFIKPGELCTLLGLCGSQSESKEEELLASHIADMSNVVAPLCVAVCAGHTSVRLLLVSHEEAGEHVAQGKNRGRHSEAAGRNLRHPSRQLQGRVRELCRHLRQGSDRVPAVGGRAHTICTLLHLCLIQELPVVETPPPSGCDSCQTLAVLSRLHLGSNVTEQKASSFLESVCQLHPFAVPKCEAFTQRYGPRLQRVMGKQGHALHICEGEGLCVAVNEVKLLGGDHCTWGREYVCGNMKTAQECDSVPYCQKYIWN
ncbi:hypothetical protein AAFF_G00177970 [Aldrovandia affinis]|uniref:Uncharacterized protein n=1 Tax=Aldrovandia affinis TaxID=143900 RepID=A0AAD7W6F8_9TELE|nr:hypothetical protein AAFF_G00177970 [Aldrovandia affinis]